MEFLRDEDINKVGSVAGTSIDKGFIVDSEGETESRLGDPSVELETTEAWLDYKETSGKRLRWLLLIGECR